MFAQPAHLGAFPRCQQSVFCDGGGGWRGVGCRYQQTWNGSFSEGRKEEKLPDHIFIGCIKAEGYKQIINIRCKALDENYNIYILLHRSDIKFSAVIRKKE